MSILNRLRLTAHLDDDALTALLADTSLGVGQPSHPHLQACAACRARFTAFGTWLEEVRESANDESDAAFTPERLASQRAQIFRRLEAAERPARVIAFPKFARPIASRSSGVYRWVATSAAAGLLVGVLLGQMVDFRRAMPQPQTSTAARYVEPPRTDRPESLLPASASSDAAFLDDVEASSTRSIATPLRAIDELTPRAPFVDDRR